jgi:hypothetical protein
MESVQLIPIITIGDKIKNKMKCWNEFLAHKK